MRRATLIFILFSFFPLAFLPGDATGGSACSNALFPPFISNGVKPNILIILDNSQSMDEDFYGNAAGSYSPASKSVVARQALQNMLSTLQGKANVGIMSFSLPSDVQSFYIHNSMPFASYNPESYCANPPPDCVTYCSTGNSTSKANCEAACPGLTTTTYATGNNFPDLILSTSVYPFNEPTGVRARYCGLIYPKTQRMVNPTDPTSYIYWNQPDPMYAGGNLGTQFEYCGSDFGSSYSAAENANNSYGSFSTKKGSGDAYVGGQYSNYTTSYTFEPTDSDWALGFHNFGQRMPWYYVGPTWFSNGQGSGSPQGYLQVPLGDISNVTQYNNVYNILNPNLNNSAGYMSCTAGNKNTCPYIINASNTPTAGALQTALNYFNGTLKQGTTTYTSPITSSCMKNYIILVTDGMPSTMLDGSQPTATTQYCYNSSGVTNNQTCTATSSCTAAYNAFCTTPVMGQVINQLYDLQTNVIQTFSGTKTTFPVNTYVLGIGSEANGNLNSMAVEGGTATSSGQAYYASNATQLSDALNSIMTNLFAGVSSGSSISILSEGQSQTGANMLQGVFYPAKSFMASTLTWPGYLYNYWFYNSQTATNMREDTVHDYILELNEDDQIIFNFTPQTGLTVQKWKDPLGSGTGSATDGPAVGLDGLTPLWEAGKLLFQTTAASRQILTPGSGATGLVSFNTSNATLTTPASSPLGNPAVTPSTFDPCLQPPGTSNTAILQNLINYVRGTDITNNYCSNGTSFNSTPCHSNSDCTSGSYTTCATLSSCKSRTVGLCSNGTAFNNTACNSNGDCTTAPYTTCTENVWKLGDIVYSTPQVQADYSYCYNGTSFNTQRCYQNSDCTSGAYTTCQKEESVVFVGANDGMLHAFQTGTLTNAGLNPSKPLFQMEELTGIPTSSMGQELWSFIPQNSLPYLRCLAVPPPGGCHLYYNDLSPTITTMNYNGVSKTVLIGGMRLGGGSISTAKYCVNGSGANNGNTCTKNSDCTATGYTTCSNPYYYLNAPSDTCSSLSSTTSFTSASALCANPATCYNPSGCTGLSSYYAIDITDVQNPVLLWEFSHPFLGYTYSGPAIIHKWLTPSTLSGDQYYVMFLSGPTSGTDGSSIQDVKVFVLTLNAGNNVGLSPLAISNVYYKDLGATTANGFGGRLFTPGLDVNADGYTDFVFFGYANSANGTSTDWTGGIGKVNTNNTDTTLALSPANWTYDITTYANIATLPVTARVATMPCFNTNYLYAGTGRYFSSQDSYGFSSNGGTTYSPNYLMAIPFTCDQYNHNCTSISSLNLLTGNATVCSNVQQGATALGQAGWQIDLDAAAADGSYLAERLITDPTTDPGTTTSPQNQIYFITSEPTSNACGYGGQSRVWGMNCATGGPIATTQPCSGYSIPASAQVGNLFLQTSTGAIYQINADQQFTGQGAGGTGTGNRTTDWYVGMPPETSPPNVQPASPTTQTGQIIQWIEK